MYSNAAGETEQHLVFNGTLVTLAAERFFVKLIPRP